MSERQSGSALSRLRQRADAKSEERRALEAGRIRDMQLHDERYDVFRGLAARRALVMVGYLMIVAAPVIELTQAPSRFEDPILGIFTNWAFVIGAVVTFVLRRATRQLVESPDEALDERLKALRDTAYRHSYWTVLQPTLIILIALVWSMDPTGRFEIVLEQQHVRAAFQALVLHTYLTPYAIIAWREREV